jgi:hypothetical protein
MAYYEDMWAWRNDGLKFFLKRILSFGLRGKKIVMGIKEENVAIRDEIEIE